MTLLSIPPAVLLYGLLLLVFALIFRARWLWGPVGGGLMLLTLLALVAWAVFDPLVRRQLLGPERLPLALFATAVVFTFWRHLLDERTRPLEERFAPRPVEDSVGSPTAGAPAVGERVAVLVVALAGVLALLAPSRPVVGEAVGGEIGWPWYLAAFGLWHELLGPAAVLLPCGLLALLVVLPWIDPDPPRDAAEPRGRRREVTVFAAIWLALYLLPAGLALFSAGPPRAAQPLSMRLWDWLGPVPPSSPLVREAPGLLLVAGWLLLPLLIFPRWRASRGLARTYRNRLGPWRARFVLLLLLLLALPPLRLLSRELMGVGAWIHLPEWGVGF